MYWLTNVATNDWSDNQSIQLAGVFITSGTKSYAAVDGSKATIPILKRFAVTDDDDRFTRRHTIRNCSAKAGATTTGALALYDLDKVTIVDRAGKATVLKLVDLSDSDRAFVAANAPIRPRP